MSNLISKKELAPARAFIPARWKQLINARIHIRQGEGAGDGVMPSDKSICIMEAVSYILGYERITDHPPCTSTVIRNQMVSLNDEINSDRIRAQLKKIVPEIVNTAPIIWKKSTKEDLKRGMALYKVVTNTKDPDYKAAEKTRQKMIDEAAAKHGDDYYPLGHMPLKQALALIIELANVAKFTGLAKMPEPDPPTALEKELAA